jgi:hypothetical protein
MLRGKRNLADKVMVSRTVSSGKKLQPTSPCNALQGSEGLRAWGPRGKGQPVPLQDVGREVAEGVIVALLAVDQDEARGDTVATVGEASG